MVTLNDLYDNLLAAKTAFASAEADARALVQPFVGMRVRGRLLESAGTTREFTATLTGLECDSEDGYTRAIFKWGTEDRPLSGTTRPCWSPALHRLVYIEPIAQRITL